MSNNQPRSLATVVGQNCRRIRTNLGLRQDDLAAAARAVGLKWTGAKVSDFEAGRWSSSFETVLSVALAMELAASAEGEDIAVTPADLIGSDGLIALTEEVTISASALSAVCRGASWASSMPTLDKPEGAQGVLSRSGLPEDRLAKRLNITREQLAQACWSLWKKSFTEERDERAGPEANAQHRGQVARIMQAEIERYIADGLNQEIPDGGR